MVTDPDCLFCKMAKGTFPVDMVHEDGLVFAIRDINPRAPTHLLVIPRQHIPTAHHLTDVESPLLGHMFAVAARLMDDMDLSQRGYRLTFNVGADGGQSVYHLHMHVLAGRQLGGRRLARLEPGPILLRSTVGKSRRQPQWLLWHLRW